LRPPATLGPDRIVRLASEAGFPGLAVDAGVPLSLIKALAAVTFGAGLRVGLAAAPLPDEPLRAGKRLPYLAALDDPEERLAAVGLARRTLEAGAPLGIGLFGLDFGPVALKAREPELRRRFARREMDDGDPGHRVLRDALEERKAYGDRLLDSCRAAVERLIPTAEREGAALLLPIAATPWQLPSPRQSEALLREFAGAPLGMLLSPGRRAVLEALGLAGPPERWPALEAAGRAVEVTDAVGLDSDLALGMGELSARAPGGLAVGAPPLVTAAVAGRPDTTVREVSRARRLWAELTARPAAPSAGG
jgi:hypothetical protein